MESNSNLSSILVVAISKKITELLDSVEYNNKEMILTKEHIKHNLSKIIKSSNNRFGKIEKRQNHLKRFLVDERGKLQIDFSYNRV